MFVHNVSTSQAKTTQFGKHYSFDIIIIDLTNIVIMNKQTTTKRIIVFKVCEQDIYISQGSRLYRITYIYLSKNVAIDMCISEHAYTQASTGVYIWPEIHSNPCTHPFQSITDNT